MIENLTGIISSIGSTIVGSIFVYFTTIVYQKKKERKERLVNLLEQLKMVLESKFDFHSSFCLVCSYRRRKKDEKETQEEYEKLSMIYNKSEKEFLSNLFFLQEMIIINLKLSNENEEDLKSDVKGIKSLVEEIMDFLSDSDKMQQDDKFEEYNEELWQLNDTISEIGKLIGDTQIK